MRGEGQANQHGQLLDRISSKRACVDSETPGVLTSPKSTSMVTSTEYYDVRRVLLPLTYYHENAKILIQIPTSPNQHERTHIFSSWWSQFQRQKFFGIEFLDTGRSSKGYKLTNIFPGTKFLFSTLGLRDSNQKGSL